MFFMPSLHCSCGYWIKESANSGIDALTLYPPLIFHSGNGNALIAPPNITQTTNRRGVPVPSRSNKVQFKHTSLYIVLSVNSTNISFSLPPFKFATAHDLRCTFHKHCYFFRSSELECSLFVFRLSIDISILG